MPPLGLPGYDQRGTKWGMGLVDESLSLSVRKKLAERGDEVMGNTPKRDFERFCAFYENNLVAVRGSLIHTGMTLERSECSLTIASRTDCGKSGCSTSWGERRPQQKKHKTKKKRVVQKDFCDYNTGAVLSFLVAD